MIEADKTIFTWSLPGFRQSKILTRIGDNNSDALLLPPAVHLECETFVIIIIIIIIIFSVA